MNYPLKDAKFPAICCLSLQGVWCQFSLFFILWSKILKKEKKKKNWKKIQSILKRFLLGFKPKITYQPYELPIGPGWRNHDGKSSDFYSSLWASVSPKVKNPPGTLEQNYLKSVENYEKAFGLLWSQSSQPRSISQNVHNFS